MKITRRTAIARVAALQAGLATLLASPSSQAQAFPDRPLRIITPYAAGGTADRVARGLAELMRKDLGQPVVIDNKPGGNTAVGAQLAAAAAPDGYTLLVCTGSTVVTNALLYPKLGYNAERDLTPVMRMAVTPLVVAINPSVPANTFAELVRLARAQPGKLNYASSGTGSAIHLASLFLEAQAGLDMAHIPFNGSSPAIAAVLSGDVQMFVDSIASSLPQIQAGKMRALAVTTPQRLKVLPDVPAVAESFPGFDVTAWYGVMAPAKTPPAVVARLNASIAKAMLDKGFREQFEALGLVIPAPTSAQAFGDFIRQERDKWAPVIKAKKITLE